LDISRMNSKQIAMLLASGDVTSELITEIKADSRITVKRLAARYLQQQDAAKKEKIRLEAMYEYERSFLAQGCQMIAGVDEAGRGPLVGPVVTAAVILPPNLLIKGINDSKKLSAKQREELFHIISEKALAISYTEVSAATIDRINIYQATVAGMYESIKQLTIAPEAVLIDAVPLNKLTVPSQSIIKGDALSQAIAAASIIAKVTRDRLMDKLDEEYPQYGFARHKGYGTKEHLEAIKKYGPCPQHRQTFAPIKFGGYS